MTAPTQAAQAAVEVGIDPMVEIQQAIEKITHYATEVINFVFAGLSPTNALMQLGAVVCAMILAFFIAKIIGGRINRVLNKMTGGGWARSLGRLVLTVIHGILFSVSAASLLALCVWVMGVLGLIPQGTSLIFVRLAYQIFYAWALLYLTMSLCTSLFGDKMFGSGARRFVSVTFWILAVMQIIGVLPQVIALMKEYSLPIGSDKLTIWTIFMGIITIILTMGVANKLADLCESGIMRMHELEMNLRVVFARICRVAFIILGVLIALSTVGINLTILSVFGGAIGVGIGFGMQKIASNYISGFIILFERSVKLSELVEVGSFKGMITKINTRYSVLRNDAGQELIVPNETFVTGAVKKYVHGAKDCDVTLEVPCGYEVDLDRAQKLLVECIKADARVNAEREPWCIVSSFGDNCLNLKAGLWVRDAQSDTDAIKRDLIAAIFNVFRQQGIVTPYMAARSALRPGSAVSA